MADAIVVTGKTVDEALKNALAQLGCGKNDIEYSILEQSSKGFLGLFGGKPAKIQVVRREKQEAKPAAPLPKVDEPVAAPEPESPEAPAASAPQSEAEAPAAESADASGITKEEAAARATAFLQDIFSTMQLHVRVVEGVPADEEEAVLLNLEGDEGEDVGILIGKHGQTLDALQYLTNLAANRGVDNGRQHIALNVGDYRQRREETLCELAGHLAEKACRIGRDVRLEPMNRHERKIIHTALQDNEQVTTRSVGDEPRRYIVIVPKNKRRRRGGYHPDDRSNAAPAEAKTEQAETAE